ncbi:hypothetical protein OG730_37165 [Streptomyces sp. NBC_01298]|uniref:hypothetical protein n=1 Tax=Streptomyces sp. NBC_01298 TaxID=2903817 RepID=UPI002E128F66|nr:hypothetical protein OG730_37165 [Streptomyces sp. NBC_01298]
MSDPVDYITRLRAEARDPNREEAFLADRRRQRRRRASVGGVAALALAGLVTWLVTSTGPRPADEPYAATALEEELWPDPWPATTNLPLRGSPARGWETGAKELPLPAPAAVGSLSARQVGEGLRRAREFVVAANLDPGVLRGGHPTAALELLDPRQPVRALLTEHLRSPGLPDSDPTEMFTRFDPAALTVADKGVRVRGRMSFAAGGVPGQLRIRADYTFVYALRRAAPLSEPGPAYDTEEVARVVVRRQLVLLYAPAGSPGVTAGKLIAADYRRQLGNHDCGTVDGFFHPYFSKEAKTADRPWPVVDPYDESTEIPAGPPRCTVPSRT